jgi:OOP family OmpA-OmpF porin
LLQLALAQAQTAADRVYVIDSRGEVAMSGAGLCWRTGFWTPAAGAAKDPAGCKCDKDLLPKEVCEPPRAGLPPGAKPSGDKITVAADALFDFDKATCVRKARRSSTKWSPSPRQIKLEVIIAVGHTDRIGSDAYNQKLSERRAARSRATWSARESKPTASTPKARARRIRSPSLISARVQEQEGHRVPAA